MFWGEERVRCVTCPHLGRGKRGRGNCGKSHYWFIHLCSNCNDSRRSSIGDDSRLGDDTRRGRIGGDCRRGSINDDYRRSDNDGGWLLLLINRTLLLHLRLWLRIWLLCLFLF
jgi:hypothetical protein